MDAFTFLPGALGGLAGTAAKLPIELAVRARYGLEGVLDWQRNQTVMARISGRSVEAAVLPGLATQFSHGLFRGMLFVLLLFVVPTQSLWPLLGIAIGFIPSVVYLIPLFFAGTTTKSVLVAVVYRYGTTGDVPVEFQRAGLKATKAGATAENPP